jgi:nitroimidazol reductase NimA-like FMN-containing flavoprotein (pyridoxamine 5'-phosphate oxidase superfamily)
MDKKEALDFVSKNKLCVLATCINNKPEAATVVYVFNEGNFYIGTNKDSRKLKNLRQNKEVAIVVGVSDELPSVQIEGKAEILTGETDKKARELFYNAGYKKYSKDPGQIYLKIKPAEFWHDGKKL